MFGNNRDDENHHSGTFKIESTPPKHTFDDLVLPDYTMSEIDQILDEEPYALNLKDYGLQPRRKIILHGPPGCGKTSVAHAAAAKLGIPLIALSSAHSISSYVGETQKIVRKQIKYARDNRCVLLLDEFDSLASARSEGGGGSTAEAYNRHHSEVVNGILCDLEGMDPKGMIFACTNFEHVIDSAVMRRFDASIRIPPVSREGLLIIVNKIFNGQFDLDAEEVLKHENTPALVTRKARDMLRRKVMEIAKKEGPRRPPEPPAIRVEDRQMVKISMPTSYAFGGNGGLAAWSSPQAIEPIIGNMSDYMNAKLKQMEEDSSKPWDYHYPGPGKKKGKGK